MDLIHFDEPESHAMAECQWMRLYECVHGQVGY